MAGPGDNTRNRPKNGSDTDAFKRAVTVDRLPVGDVVAALSANPAKLLGRYDRVGSLEPGKDADLVVLDADFDLKGVMRRGEWVIDPQLG